LCGYSSTLLGGAIGLTFGAVTSFGVALMGPLIGFLFIETCYLLDEIKD
jgi:hypothetical protein